MRLLPQVEANDKAIILVSLNKTWKVKLIEIQNNAKSVFEFIQLSAGYCRTTLKKEQNPLVFLMRTI